MESPFPIYAVPAFLLVVFIATYVVVKSLSRKPQKPLKHEVVALGEPEVATGTVYVSDGEGHTVRRSTRTRKPVTPLPVPATPSRSTRSKAAAAAAEETPKPAVKATAVTPRTTRTRRAAAPVEEPDSSSPVEEASPKPRSRRTPRA
ncbi:hypothetical protein GPECTOR_110g240 [Gonium pectorale]|uniref:Uncharacterized protein n=1 Tax=Gonium pectorale TaxID=33097 RepID=A0A150FZD6_GONPE|nr:hypothetical protein GPECTOR_110g240 [Gonium pectorale]|eukprot:KXZ42947.1 hypothetical protein GPECTOR_110g240 [Gonium pectorale]